MIKKKGARRIERNKGRMKQEREVEGRRGDLAQNLKGEIYFEAGKKQPKDQRRNSYTDVE